MADSVSLLSIRSYHCHESGYCAKDVFGGCILGHGLAWEMFVAYITLHHWQRRFRRERLETFIAG